MKMIGSMKFVILMLYFAECIAFSGKERTSKNNDNGSTIPTIMSWDDQPMPTHRRFLEEKNRRLKARSNNRIFSDGIISNRDHETEETVSNPLETNRRTLDILSSSWWVKLGEGNYAPESRRAHSAALYTVDIRNQGNQSSETNQSQVVDPNVNQASNTSKTEPENGRNMNTIKPSTREYMIITGGFTDRDWKTFPVLAYDMTASVENGEGRWFELTPFEKNDAMCKNETHHYNPNQIYSWENSHPCGPESRIGHISVVRDNYLYVFGGLLYNEVDGVFFMEKIPFMYRMLLIENEFDQRDYENNQNNFTPDPTSLSWERISPNVKEPPPEFIGVGSVSNSFDDLLQMVNRGEVRGGYWETEDKLVIYGGLHVRHYEVNFGHKQQSDETLGDVWAYDFKTNTWEMLSPAWSNDEMPHPGARTSHGGVVVGDELIITGGLREEEMYVWDGTTIWQQLDDVWVFNLKSGIWKERIMLSPIGRSYQSVVGFETNDKAGSVIVAFGGFKSMMDPVDNQMISYVYDDTLISFPPTEEWTQKSIWLVATYGGVQTNMISTRLEHSAVLSKKYGIMLVWGGRYRGTSEISGLWSLNVAGPGSTVKYDIRTEDDEMNDAGFAYVVLIMIMMTSMMFTYMCGVIHRRMEGNAMSMDDLNADPTAGGSVFGRTGLNQDIIDTLPLKTYSEKDSNNENAIQSRNNEESNIDTDSSLNLYETDYDENCCPICLGEYTEGEAIRCLPCNHEFHKECVDNWLANHASCPACRHSLQDLVNLTTVAESVASQIRAATARFTSRRSASENQTEIELSTIAGHQSESSDHGGNDPTLSDTSSGTNAALGPRTIVRLQNIMRLRGMNRILRIPSRDLTTTNSNDSFDEFNGEIGYSSSLELTEELDQDRSSSFDDSELPIAGRPRQMRVNSHRQERRSRRHAVRVRRQNRGRQPTSPLNTPLQPSDNSIV